MNRIMNEQDLKDLKRAMVKSIEHWMEILHVFTTPGICININSSTRTINYVEDGQELIVHYDILGCALCDMFLDPNAIRSFRCRGCPVCNHNKGLYNLCIGTPWLGFHECPNKETAKAMLEFLLMVGRKEGLIPDCFKLNFEMEVVSEKGN